MSSEPSINKMNISTKVKDLGSELIFPVNPDNVLHIPSHTIFFPFLIYTFYLECLLWTYMEAHHTAFIHSSNINTY